MNCNVYCVFCNWRPANGLVVLCSVLLNRPNVIIMSAMTSFGYSMASGHMPTNPMDAVRERF